MSGCYKGQYLVMNLLIRHGVSLVLRLKQHREYIAHITSIRTALLIKSYTNVSSARLPSIILPKRVKGRSIRTLLTEPTVLVEFVITVVNACPKLAL